MRSASAGWTLLALVSCADFIGPDPYGTGTGGGGSTSLTTGGGGEGAGVTSTGAGPAGGGGSGAGGEGGQGGEAPVGPITSLDVGRVAACAVRNGAVYCWGRNEFGVLGVGDDDRTVCRSTPVAVGLTGSAAEVDMGADHACARTSSGDVWCWGNDAYAQVTGNTILGEPVLSATQTALTDVAALGVGGDHSCVREQGGKFKCWGRNDSGQIRAGMSGPAEEIIEITSTQAATAVEAGGSDTCLVAGKAADCFGEHPEIHGRSERCAVAGRGIVQLSDIVVDLSIGAAHACALFDNAAYECWGLTAITSSCNGSWCDDGDGLGCVLFTGSDVDLIASADTFACTANEELANCFGMDVPDMQGESPDALNRSQLGLRYPIRLLAAGGGAVCASDTFDVVCWSGEDSLVVDCGMEPPNAPFKIGFPE